jgi:hypothetical protein
VNRRKQHLFVAALLLCGTLLAASLPASADPAPAGPTPGSTAYMERDIANMEAAFGRNEAQLEDPTYASSLLLDGASLYASQGVTQLENPTRPSLTFGSLIPVYAQGEPDRSGWNGTRGQELPVTFTASDGAALRGDVFAPLPGARDPYTGQRLVGPFPGAVIVPGSIQAPTDDYFWLAEDLAERGYVTLVFNVQGQGQSETLPHQGTDPNLPGCTIGTTAPGQDTPCAGVPSEQDQNFIDSTENAISFFLSTPTSPYPDVAAATLAVNHYNPLWDLFDYSPDTRTATPGRTTRLALIGHSTGAVITSYLQGVDPRIEVAVALDKITATANAISDDQAETGSLPGPVVPVVPTLGVQSEYGFAPQPYFEASCSSFEPCPAAPGGTVGAPDLTAAPDPYREEDTGFTTWLKSGVDSMVIVPRASTHLIYTDAPPVLPASLNGQAMASYYVQAWLNEFLAHQKSAGAQLLSPTINYIGPNEHGQWVSQSFNRDDNLSFYFCSGYQFGAKHGPTLTNVDLNGDGCS